MSEIDIAHVASQLNVAFDIPFVPESMEQAWLVWILDKSVPVIPIDIWDFIADASDGLTVEDQQRHEDAIVIAVNKLIDLPVIPESVEEALIRPVIHSLLQYAVKGASLTLYA